MTLFVREDEDLQWFRDGQMIENSGRRAVTYRDGTSSAAQRGGVIPGRVAVLTICNPVVEEDSGTYTCEIARTSESLDVQLSVLPAGGECFQCQCIPEWNRIPSIVIRCSFSPLNIWEQDYTPPPPPPPPPATSPATSPAITVQPLLYSPQFQSQSQIPVVNLSSFCR